MPVSLVKSKFADTPYAITVVVRLSKKIISRINEDNGPTHMYYHHYRTVNTLIDQITLKAVLFLQNAGYNAIAIPASQTIPDKEKPHNSDFSHKIGAVMSGLGRIGKSSLFIDRDYGPGVRLGTILTDMELPIINIEHEENKCANCNMCVNHCPANAIKGNLWDEHIDTNELVDIAACNDYMRNHYMGIGRSSVCGICIKVCPDSRIVR
jgi:epoxyqueuosine reductase QueG